MRGLWQRMNYRVRDQLLWSSVPMLLLALAAIGIGSWILLGGQFTRASLHHRGHELAFFRQGAMDRAVSEALSAAVAARESGSGSGVTGSEDRSLVVACLSGTGAPQTGVSGSLAAWWRDHHQDEAVPWTVDLKNHRVEILSPLVVALEPEDDPVGLLPVVVTPRGAEGRDSGSKAVYFLDLQGLLTMNSQGAWWCALDPDGRVVAGSDPELPRGERLENLVGAMSSGPWAGRQESRLLADLQQAATEQAARGIDGPVGLHRGAWLVTMDKGSAPLRLLMGTPARDLQVMISRYTAVGLALGILAIFLASAGIVRVVGRASGRLYTLGKAMRAVARGELDRRVEVSSWDEVGTLIGYFNGMADDVRKNRRLAEHRTAQLRSSLADLKRLDLAKQEFLTLVSHEVRTPLTAIKGGLEYLRSSTEKVTPQEKAALEAHNLTEILDIIDKNTRRLGGFMNDATLMANIQSLHKRLTVAVAPIREVIKEILAAHAASIADLDLEVHNEIADDLGWNLLGDMEMLRIALEKVIDNAVIHNIEGGRIVIREVESVPGLGGPEVLRGKLGNVGQGIFEDDRWQDNPVNWRLIEVFNTGQSIPSDRREALFTEFELVNPIANHQRGTGLSMPIVKTALERHGGGVFVSSSEAGGNSFYLLIPTVDHAVAGKLRPLVNLWDDPGQGLGGVPWNEDVDVRGQETGLDVELADRDPVAAGQLGQPGGGMDHAGRSDHQQDPAL